MKAVITSKMECCFKNTVDKIIETHSRKDPYKIKGRFFKLGQRVIVK